jgi:hypothetical protein
MVMSALAYSHALLVTSFADMGGAGYIAGTVTVAGAPSARWVEVRHRATRRVVATQFSDADDGTYRFDGLDPAQEFDVIGRDWQRVYEDVQIGAVRPMPYVGDPPDPPDTDYQPPAGDEVDIAFDDYVASASIAQVAVWAA